MHPERHLFKKELESLVGLLQFCNKGGSPRLLRKTTLHHERRWLKSDHHIQRPGQVSCGGTSFWNGISMLRDVGVMKSDVIVTSDASGSWWCEAFWEKAWFHFQWWERLQCHIHATSVHSNSGRCGDFWKGVVWQDSRILGPPSPCNSSCSSCQS